MITFQDISKSYGEVQALHDVSFTIQDGEVFGFVGADGAGKSTLLRILLGLMRPDAGTVTIHGEAPGRVPVGYVAQRFSLYPNLTARENMELMGGALRTGSAAGA
ncbi:MAG: ATP-binding cassette domain-containing protein [Negativicoccus succinicivorans]|uniref:ATP-binding cassette domain-containing protein n=1 Tax=Negativicoccus succinicivorans TaxID=620903 RepID=UPI00290D4F7F|nr:ATP-binding cassette domain-containing protein [Negativicoccus succinicivorans]MDU5915420.1 ATP-binding cassette domain-containing protein [Negativicoccus succinicivorans]